MEKFTGMKVTALRSLFSVATGYKNGRLNEDELHLAVKYIALALSNETWDDGRHTVRQAVQIAGIFSDDHEMREVYKKIFDDVFEY
jgi:hypothetical protein